MRAALNLHFICTLLQVHVLRTLIKLGVHSGSASVEENVGAEATNNRCRLMTLWLNFGGKTERWFHTTLYDQDLGST